MAGGVVVVTGASTGIGASTAAALAEAGFRVLAGVRRDEDAARLGAHPSGRVEAVRLDVTSESDVASLANVVRQAGGALQGLVNNAGIAVVGPVELLPVADWRRQLEVNLIGQVAVTRALLPALLSGRARVVNMSSIGGLVAGPLFGPYSASKFALEAFTDVLRRELTRTGVRVVAVEPGSIATPIWAKGRADGERLASPDPQAVARYARLTSAVRAMAARGAEDGLPPDIVAAVVVRAMTSRRPRTRYLVGRDARLQAWADRLLPDRAMDALIRRAMR